MAITIAFRVWVLMHGYVSLREMAGFRMMPDSEWRSEVVAAVRQLLSGEARPRPEAGCAPS